MGHPLTGNETGRRRLLLAALVAVLGIAAVQRLADGFSQLVSGPIGAIDLGLRHLDVHEWFAGRAIYESRLPVYPPASLALLWPLLGWLDLPRARWLWAATTALALAWLAVLVVRAVGARSGLEQATAALLVPAIYATRAVIVNGQLALHVLAVLLPGLLLLERARPGWRRDLGAAACIVVALVKPSIAAPFVWLLLFARGPWRPALLVAGGYVALTAVAAAFQPASPSHLVGQWLAGAPRDAARAAVDSHANVQSWLTAVGLGGLALPASLLVLGLCGWWVWRHRDADVWIRLGVVALVARLWVFHYRYDDVLIVVPLVALWRLATGAPDAAASAALGLTAATMLAPARLFFLPPPWTALFESTQTVVWLGALAFLGYRASRPASPLAKRPASVIP